LGVVHVILVVPLFALQMAHLALHFGWIKKNVRTRILTRIPVRQANT
jgi:alpha-beta hydrolase superfamily lysophospholipase